MGYIRKSYDSKKKARIFDLSRVMDNQNLLMYQLHDLVRDTRRVRFLLRRIDFETELEGNEAAERFLPPVSSSALAILENFNEIPKNPVLDFHELVKVFKEQDSLVQMALVLGEERRDRSAAGTFPETVSGEEDQNLRAWRVLYNQIQTRSEDFEERYQTALNVANRRITLDDLNKQIEGIIKETEVGDIIDIAGYRGTGYYLVVENNLSTGSFKAIKTKGQYGCHLPSEAWELIIRHGLQFFEKADVWGCILPERTRIAEKEREFDDVANGKQHLFSWLTASETLIIDGMSFKGDIQEISSAENNN